MLTLPNTIALLSFHVVLLKIFTIFGIFIIIVEHANLPDLYCELLFHFLLVE